MLDARSNVAGGIESLVRQRDQADTKAPLLIGDSDDSVVDVTRVVTDLRLLGVIVDDCRVVRPVGDRHVEVAGTDQLRRSYVYTPAHAHSHTMLFVSVASTHQKLNNYQMPEF